MDVCVPEDLAIFCDGDRMVQVLVNLLRNAVDAMDGTGPAGARPDSRIDVGGATYMRDGVAWVSVTISDSGPGIGVEMLGRLFQPFASTRLDSEGTGLGLAVAEGIVRGHGGVILARNRSDGPGAVFEVVLPGDTPPSAAAASPDDAPRGPIDSPVS